MQIVLDTIMLIHNKEKTHSAYRENQTIHKLNLSQSSLLLLVKQERIYVDKMEIMQC